MTTIILSAIGNAVSLSLAILLLNALGKMVEDFVYRRLPTYYYQSVLHLLYCLLIYGLVAFCGLLTIWITNSFNYVSVLLFALGCYIFLFGIMKNYFARYRGVRLLIPNNNGFHKKFLCYPWKITCLYEFKEIDGKVRELFEQEGVIYLLHMRPVSREKVLSYFKSVESYQIAESLARVIDEKTRLDDNK